MENYFCFSFIVLVTVGIFLQGESKPFDEEHKHKCGYNACHPVKEGYINFHIIPHTHDDVGWLKTFDQYFYGSEPSIYQAGVQYILDSVVQELRNDPKKRFIYVETAFFFKWWDNQPKKIQRIVKRLVNEGRLEFIGGGWSMSDEGATLYQAVIDNYSWGLRKLNETFGECAAPRIGWQIDPFGHARETSSIMARIGFDAHFFGRLDWRDKTEREETKNLEMIWEASANLGDEADIFTGVLYNTYSSPNGFNFDVIFGGNDPVIDDKNNPDYNVDELVDAYLEDMKNRLEVYKGSNIAICMGDDFNYQGAGAYFVNIDRLIKALNARQTNGSKYHFLYSTPSCYAKALNDEGQKWSTKQDDFFPYAGDPNSYWSGYYTSRPALKRYERISNNFLQVCKQLFSLSNLGTDNVASLDTLREAVGVLQHHDAIAGTERQLVAFDYARLLSIGMDRCGDVAEAALNKLLPISSSSKPVVLESCNLLNVSQCEVSESQSSFVVTLYNPLSRSVSRYVRLPVSGDGTSYIVYNYQGQAVTSQVVPIPDAVFNIPGRTSSATVELVFQASDLPPLGFLSFYVYYYGSSEHTQQSVLKTTKAKTTTIGWDGSLQLTLNAKTGLPTKLTVPEVSETFDFQQNFYYYESAAGDNEIFANRSSGAYIFRPNSSLIAINAKPTSVKFYSGDLVQEVHQEFSSWVSQVIRAYKGEDHLEFNWVVGPIPIDDGKGKEIVSQYTVVNLQSGSTWYTDSNGREMIERIRFFRPTFNVTMEEPISMNYDPITTRISMRDETTQVSVLTDRAEGGSSLEDGELEVMLHRRCLNDDAFGVAEALNETAFGTGLVVRGSHFLTAGSISNQSAADRRLIQQRVLDAWTFFTPTTLTLSAWQMDYQMRYLGLQSDLPENIQILTLEPWTGTSFLLRLESILEVNDDETASTPVTVNLNDIFNHFTITSVRETNLAANKWLDEVTRLVWTKEDGSKTPSTTKLQDLPYVTLNPMDIKTFIIEVSF